MMPKRCAYLGSVKKYNRIDLMIMKKLPGHLVRFLLVRFVVENAICTLKFLSKKYDLHRSLWFLAVNVGSAWWHQAITWINVDVYDAIWRH